MVCIVSIMAEKSIEAGTGQHGYDWDQRAESPPPSYSSLFGDTVLSGGGPAQLTSLEGII